MATPHQREDRDVFRLAPGMDSSVMDMIAARLEFRGTDPGYAKLSQAYFGRLPLASAGRILALGCGTGIEVRALRRLVSTSTNIVGVDHSSALIDAAQKLTADEGLSDGVEYETGDVHDLRFGAAEFDIVTMHTLVSHVDDPLQALREAGRVARPGGTVAIFDGDYASLTFAYADPALAVTIEEKLKQVLVANPRVMRDMPLLLREAALELVHGEGTLYADIGTSSFWANAAEAYGTVLARSELIAADVVDAWRAYQKQAVVDGTFFGASNYYTFLAKRPG